MRLIDADELTFDRLTDSICQGQAEDVVAEAPTIEAEPVRRGRWIPVKGYVGILYKCSACDSRWSHTTIETPYCSQCGAKMDGERRTDEQDETDEEWYDWRDEQEYEDRWERRADEPNT